MSRSVEGFGLRLMLVFVAVVIASACAQTTASNRDVSVVAGVYPLAWAAAQVGGDDVTVHDLTPRGGEAHDLQLTARQRSTIQRASVVLLVGKGFQPEVERAAADADVTVIDVTKGLELRQASDGEAGADPHVWLDPISVQHIVKLVAEALSRARPSAREGFEQRARETTAGLAKLDMEYRDGLKSCSLTTLVTTHEAFAYLSARYGLTQLGLTGVTPESEPSAAQIQRVRELAADRKVEAIFFEATDEGRRAGASVARDVGVPALPLNTLESNPAPRDYLSQMRENLAKLREGLRCG